MYRILIVEDEFLLAALLESQQELLGHRIIKHVDSGEEAIRSIIELEPDIVIMDILLKGNIDGIDAIKKASESVDFEVIYTTGNNDPYIKQRAMETKPLGIIGKPIEIKQLKSMIDNSHVKRPVQLD